MWGGNVRKRAGIVIDCTAPRHKRDNSHPRIQSGSSVCDLNISHGTYAQAWSLVHTGPQVLCELSQRYIVNRPSFHVDGSNFGIESGP
jgi:hypothetical protein